MKSLFVISLLLGLGMGNAFSQFDMVHYVTSPSQTGPGSINEKIIAANAQANAGNSVIVYFDVPDTDGDGEALISISSALTEISNPGGGSIHFAPNPHNSADQGLEGDYPVSNTNTGLSGLGLNNAKNITINSLNFQNFRRDNNSAPISGIHARFSENVITINCSFENNNGGIFFTESYGEIKFNTFLNHTTTAIQYGDDVDHFGPAKLDIKNNTINYSSVYIPLSDGGGSKNGILARLKNSNSNLSILVNKNVISDCKSGIEFDFANPDCNSTGIVNRLSLSIIENTISRTENTADLGEGIALYGVVSDWVVEDNLISNQEIAIIYQTACDYVTGPPVPLADNYTIDFIETNDLGYTPVNTGNKITNCGTSFSHRSNLSSKIIGYKVDGHIGGKPNRRTIIRQNLIQVTNVSDLPIAYELPLEPMNDKLTLDEATYEEGTLKLQFDANALSAENGTFYIDVYEAAADGSLIAYLGNKEITGNIDDDFFIQSGVLLTSTRIGATITSTGGGEEDNILGTSEVEFIEITPLPCISCNSFNPSDTAYWLSAWVNVETPNQVKSFYSEDFSPSLELNYFGSGMTSDHFYPTGEIIDGWQRIVGKFTVPSETDELQVVLNAHPDFDTYFDDIRIHPFNGSMKSYVYDGETFWLTSELDDNNYATFYEYDEEGGLIRIKKETARGIVTIQETRSNTVKEEISGE